MKIVPPSARHSAGRPVALPATASIPKRMSAPPVTRADVFRKVRAIDHDDIGAERCQSVCLRSAPYHVGCLVTTQLGEGDNVAANVRIGRVLQEPLAILEIKSVAEQEVRCHRVERVRKLCGRTFGSGDQAGRAQDELDAATRRTDDVLLNRVSCNEKRTRSPALQPFTALPTSAMRPTPSIPGAWGNGSLKPLDAGDIV